MKLFYAVLFLLTIFETKSLKLDFSSKEFKKYYLNAKQLIRKFGYPSESHTVQTADGYLIEMHRIPHGKSSSMTSTGDKPPIFLFHGLFGSSESFFTRESPNDLPFLLADLGFDVWLGNVRGNEYSKAHVTLHPDDNKFWDFSWHESGTYDAPAQIDFILSHTKQKKIIFIGISMGTTIFFALTSTLPEYNKKIELSLMLGSVAYIGHLISPTIQIFINLAKPITKVVNVLNSGALFSDTHSLKAAGKNLCTRTNLEKKLCWSILSSIAGFDHQEFNESLIPNVIAHYPSGYSVKAFDHYSQIAKSGKFRQYDYGIKGNILRYGSKTPPDYKLNLITTPIYMYEGKNDYLSDLKDSIRLSKELKSLKKMRIIDYPKFTHLDYLLSSHAKKLVFDVMINDLMSHLNQSNKIH